MFKIIIALIVLITIKNIFLSIFCRLMKRRDSRRISQLKENHIENRINDKSEEHHSKIILYLFRWVEDFSFLDFKLVGYIPSHVIRNFLYKQVFRMEIGFKAIIYYGLETRRPWNIKIGSGSIIGDHTIFDARWGIFIGSNVNMSTGVWAWTLQHDLNSENFSTDGQEGSIVISDRAWISSRTTLLPGVSIAEGVVVAAGSVVTKPVFTPFSVVGGIPAKEISKRNCKLNYVFDGKHRNFI